jgi:hypothetical protein
MYDRKPEQTSLFRINLNKNKRVDEKYKSTYI